MFFPRIIRSIRPLTIAMLAALAISGTTAGVAFAASAQGQPSHSQPTAARWCIPGNPPCPAQLQTA
jgi:hypothetical protein